MKKKSSPKLKKVVGNRKQLVHDRGEPIIEWTLDSQVIPLLGAACVHEFSYSDSGQGLTYKTWQKFPMVESNRTGQISDQAQLMSALVNSQRLIHKRPDSKYFKICM